MRKQTANFIKIFIFEVTFKEVVFLYYQLAKNPRLTFSCQSDVHTFSHKLLSHKSHFFFVKSCNSSYCDHWYYKKGPIFRSRVSYTRRADFFFFLLLFS